MGKIFGYGEDALTLWALKHRTPDILESLKDQTGPSNCVIFYRPSFGRGGGEKSAEFGEFDAILASSKNIYLIESKWDNLSRFNKREITLRTEQKIRHRIFSWYLMHWDKKYSNDWERFRKEHMYNFQRHFPKKRIATTDSLLAKNLESILTALQKRCGKLSFGRNIKNVLLFFYDKKKSISPTKITKDFELVEIDYSQEITGNFVTLD
jgi:hypothetical protein